jgi:hypothetical protein
MLDALYLRIHAFPHGLDPEQPLDLSRADSQNIRFRRI